MWHSLCLTTQEGSRLGEEAGSGQYLSGSPMRTRSEHALTKSSLTGYSHLCFPSFGRPRGQKQGTNTGCLHCSGLSHGYVPRTSQRPRRGSARQ